MRQALVSPRDGASSGQIPRPQGCGFVLFGVAFRPSWQGLIGCWIAVADHNYSSALFRSRCFEVVAGDHKFLESPRLSVDLSPNSSRATDGGSWPMLSAGVTDRFPKVFRKLAVERYRLVPGVSAFKLLRPFGNQDFTGSFVRNSPPLRPFPRHLAGLAFLHHLTQGRPSLCQVMVTVILCAVPSAEKTVRCPLSARPGSVPGLLVLGSRL